MLEAAATKPDLVLLHARRLTVRRDVGPGRKLDRTVKSWCHTPHDRHHARRRRTGRGSYDDLLAELRSWLDQNWDPDLTVGEWWERLGLAGWAAPTWPEQWYGRGAEPRRGQRHQSRDQHTSARSTHRRVSGLLLAGPTIVAHGTDEQRARFLPDIVTGKKAWCQLFSEPGAGSDLAGLQAKAVRDGDEWIVNGQKVWTSGAQAADLGMLLARTDVDVPKHRGITYFALDMDQPGVDIRPLREMTGRALFNEVFMTDCRVADADVIGGLNNGWAVANTTLANERAGLGAGGGGAFGGAFPGEKAGFLERRAGDFTRPDRAAGVMTARGASFLIDLAKGNGAVDDPTIRQDLDAALHHERDRPVHEPARQGGQGRGSGRRAGGQHGQALDEPHHQAVPRSRARASSAPTVSSPATALRSAAWSPR